MRNRADSNGSPAGMLPVEAENREAHPSSESAPARNSTLCCARFIAEDVTRATPGRLVLPRVSDNRFDRLLSRKCRRRRYYRVSKIKKRRNDSERRFARTKRASQQFSIVAQRNEALLYCRAV